MPPPSALPRQYTSGDDALVLAGERGPGAAEAGLDLVGDHQHVVRGAQLAHPRQVAGGRHDHARLALDRLDEERDDVRVGGQGLGERVGVAVLDDEEAGRERPEPGARRRRRSRS